MGKYSIKAKWRQRSFQAVISCSSLFLLLLTASLSRCTSDDSSELSDIIGNSAGPTVKASPTYTINAGGSGDDCTEGQDSNDLTCEEAYPAPTDIKYGEGIAYKIQGVTIVKYSKDLNLHIYYPINDESTSRPAFMFIHGGSFLNGNKDKYDIRKMAHYFARRGWVYISIDYRTGERDIFPHYNSVPDFSVPTDLPYYTKIVPYQWARPSYLNAVAAHPLTLDRTRRAGIAMYPAQRDAKAALRWLVANAETYNINKDYITVGGHSAGAITAVTLGVSNHEDFRDELRADNEAGDPEDSTLETTNLHQTYSVRSIVNFWGGPVKLDNFHLFNSIAETSADYRFDSNDPELFTAHGTSDPNSFTPPPRHEVHNPANDNLIHAIYTDLGIYNEYIPLVNKGHDAWDATVDGKSLFKLAFDFLVERQGLQVE